GEARLADLRSRSNLGPRAWAALVNLIDDGVLELAAGSRIGQDAMVRLREAPTATPCTQDPLADKPAQGRPPRPASVRTALARS
ncbi:hypothetical protein, partial [Nitrospirillum viridazoti]